MGIEIRTRDQSWIPRAPDDIEAPLIGFGDLREHLSILLIWIRVPAHDAVVFAAGNEQIRVFGAPGKG